jgi:hypothetical protein
MAQALILDSTDADFFMLYFTKQKKMESMFRASHESYIIRKISQTAKITFSDSVALNPPHLSS